MGIVNVGGILNASGGVSFENQRDLTQWLQSADVLPKFSAKINKVFANDRTSTNSLRTRILVAGDSTTDSGLNISWVHKVVNSVNNSGLCYAHHNCSLSLNLTDARFTFGSSWTKDTDTNKYSAGRETWKATTATNALTFRPDRPTAFCRVWYIQTAGGGVLSLDASGTSTVTADTNGADGVGYLDLAVGFSNWDWNVKWVSGGQVNVIGFETSGNVSYAGNSEISISRASLGGTSSRDWVNTTKAWSWLNAMKAYAPDLFIMQPGINESSSANPAGPVYVPGYDVSVFRSDIKTIIQGMQSVGSECILVTPIPQNPTDGTFNNPVSLQDAMVDAIRSVAQELNVPLIDIYARWGPRAYGTGTTEMYYADSWVHPSTPGTSAIANAVSMFLFGSTVLANNSSRSMRTDQIDVVNGVFMRGQNILTGGGSTVTVGADAAANTFGIGPWNTIIGSGAGAAISSGFGNTLVGYQVGQVLGSGKQYNVQIGYQAGLASTCNNSVLIGRSAGSTITSGNNNIAIGPSVGSTTLTTGGSNILIGTTNATTTPAASTSNHLNIENTIKGTTALGTNPGVCGVGMESLLGVLKGANFNTTSDNTITLTHPITGGKYLITRIIVTNASINLTTAAGGVYTGASKTGTTLVAAGQVYTKCSSATGVQQLTLATGATDNTFTGTSIYLALTTAQGATATADVYVMGIPLA